MKNHAKREIAAIVAAAICALLASCPDPSGYSGPQSVELADTGLPVVNIYTKNAKGITSKETYVKTDIYITSDNPDHSLARNGLKDEIRGRGNATWKYPKKPYRIRFAEKVSLFGLEPARNWVLLAEYRSPTMMLNAIALELGKVFGLPFTNHYVHVDVVLNGNYQGTYLLTEHMQVEKGRVDIDKNQGFLVEMDRLYDEEPKFRTARMKLPVMVKSPEGGDYAFVKESINSLEDALLAPGFPESGYRDLIDMDTFVDYILINDILMNWELQAPASVYMYKDSGGKISMGPLWDFDCGFGYEDDIFSFFRKYTGRMPNFPDRDGWEGQPFFQKFFDDPVFMARYHARWNEMKGDIIPGMGTFISDMQDKLRSSAEMNARVWYYWKGNYGYNNEAEKLKAWWGQRTSYLDGEINK